MQIGFLNQPGKERRSFETHVVLHGTIVNNNDGEVIDEVLLFTDAETSIVHRGRRG